MERAQEPTAKRVEEGPWAGSTDVDHPAFGMVSVTRWTGGGQDGGFRMFGSDLRHRSGLTVTLSTASMRRGLSNDWHHEKDTLVEFTMSESQWARFVSSVGVGSGVPITLRRYMSDGLVVAPAIAEPELTKKERHGEELRRTMEEALGKISESIDRLSGMLDSGKIGKTELRGVVHEMRIAVGNLPSNVEYALTTFDRATEQSVDDARTEIEAHIAGLAQRIGMKELRSSSPSLDGGAKTMLDT